MMLMPMPIPMPMFGGSGFEIDKNDKYGKVWAVIYYVLVAITLILAITYIVIACSFIFKVNGWDLISGIKDYINGIQEWLFNSKYSIVIINILFVIWILVFGVLSYIRAIKINKSKKSVSKSKNKRK